MARPTPVIDIFDRPYLLALAVLLPALLGWVVVVGARRGRQLLAQLGCAAMVARLVPTGSIGTSRWRAARLGAAGAFAALALAGPRWGQENVIVRGQGVDIVLALDASLSML